MKGVRGQIHQRPHRSGVYTERECGGNGIVILRTCSPTPRITVWPSLPHLVPTVRERVFQRKAIFAVANSNI